MVLRSDYSIFKLKTRKVTQILLLVVTSFAALAQSQLKQDKTMKQDKLGDFQEYLKKSSLYHHMKTFLDPKSKGANNKKAQKTILDVIDTSDELFSFDIGKIPVDAALMNASRRFFTPPGQVRWPAWHNDPYSLKPRFYELMKQTIYEVRDNLIIIQDLREKYNWHSLYKMGYLFSRTDAQLKLFSQMSHKYYQQCRVARDTRKDWFIKYNPTQLGEMIERILNHWFEIDLLYDVIRVNDDAAHRTLNYMKSLDELDTWFIDKFGDVFHIYNKVKAENDAKRKAKQEKKWAKEQKKLEQEKLDEEGGEDELYRQAEKAGQARQ